MEGKPIINVHHIDFVFGDQRWKLRHCDLIVKFPQMKNPTVRLHIQAKSSYQKKIYIKVCMENEDQPIHQKFRRWIFNSGGHLKNARPTYKSPTPSGGWGGGVCLWLGLNRTN
eukprot:TRINITY_DN15898_c0_g1_i1.p2 TRINITY_DN15898_c0_g1~~TRINITY_DN15898_c0_g1_i1.p2  ORF type:complete len:113 (+),score=7.91 TRINITY_DN15898_c0_g1_i1:209-547(+)